MPRRANTQTQQEAVQENAAVQTEQDTGPDAGTQGMTEFQSEAQTESAATAENPDSQPEQGWMDEIFGENRSGCLLYTSDAADE